ncbi:MAG: F0F1 ATP synthase subunit delta [Arcanobacterium sp.]|nr:F0F1 ATP synthase subunit delta [Arcanobacterium sp.]
MRSGSAAALQRVKDTWNSLLQEKQGQELAFAEELFQASDLLLKNTALTRALEDDSRSVVDRQTLSTAIFGNRVSGDIADLLNGLVRESWSEPGDFALAVENLAVETVLAGSQAQGLLSKTEEELYQLMRLLKENRELRLALTNKQYAAITRKELAVKVLPSLNPFTQALLARGLDTIESQTLVAALSSYVNAAAQRGEHLVAAVTSAIPLTDAQQERLTQILAAHYGENIQLHIALNPEIIGGLRIRIGDEVIDGTLATRLAMVKEEINN